MLRRLTTTNTPAEEIRAALTQSSYLDREAEEAVARAILADVRARGDAAVLEYTRRFDAPELSDLRVSAEERAAAQAVGAMAYGTETIPRVDKIVGPGNIYAVLAKRLVFGHAAIEMLPGPTEVLVIADESANARFVAADLLSQAEHGEDSLVILLT